MDIWGFVYLIWYGENFYKIGYGKSATKRHIQLQRTSPKRLHLLDTCYCYNPKRLEKRLHDKYASKKLRRGEFFRLSDGEVGEVLAEFRERRGTVINEQ